MIRSFADRATEDIFNGKSSPGARRALPRQLVRTALRKLEQLDSVERLDDLVRNVNAVLGDENIQGDVRHTAHAGRNHPLAR